MTGLTAKALRVVIGYIADKGYAVGQLRDSGDKASVMKGEDLVAELHYDDLLGVLNIRRITGECRSLFLYHPTILLFLDGLFDPPPPLCDPDR